MKPTFAFLRPLDHLDPWPSMSFSDPRPSFTNSSWKNEGPEGCLPVSSSSQILVRFILGHCIAIWSEHPRYFWHESISNNLEVWMCERVLWHPLSHYGSFLLSASCLQSSVREEASSLKLGNLCSPIALELRRMQKLCRATLLPPPPEWPPLGYFELFQSSAVWNAHAEKFSAKLRKTELCFAPWLPLKEPS